MNGRIAADFAAIWPGDGVRTCSAAKLARALEMDFFPELREKTGAECHHSSDFAVQSDLRSVDMTPRAKLEAQGVNFPLHADDQVVAAVRW